MTKYSFGRYHGKLSELSKEKSRRTFLKNQKIKKQELFKLEFLEFPTILDKDNIGILTIRQSPRFEKRFSSPYIIKDLSIKNSKEHDVRVIKSIYGGVGGKYPSILKQLGLNIVMLKSGAKYGFDTVKEYFLSKAEFNNLKTSEGYLKSMKTLPWKHYLQLDWNNEQIRIFGKRSKGEWIDMDIAESGNWKEWLIKKKKSMIRKHWIKTIDTF